MLEIKVKRLSPTSRLPTKAYVDDLGWDVYADSNYALNTHSWIIQPRQTVVIQLGIAIELPQGWGALLRTRSSQGRASIHIFGGVFDNSFRGEWAASVHNAGDKAIIYERGEKVAQIVLVPQPESTVVEVAQLSETERQEKKFGSSGR